MPPKNSQLTRIEKQIEKLTTDMANLNATAFAGVYRPNLELGRDYGRNSKQSSGGKKGKLFFELHLKIWLTPLTPAEEKTLVSGLENYYVNGSLTQAAAVLLKTKSAQALQDPKAADLIDALV